MSLFRKKCMYCRAKIEKGQEEFKEVKILGYVGTFNKSFCSKEHADKYEQELEEHMNKPKIGGGSCCG